MAAASLTLHSCYKVTALCLHGAWIWCTFVFACTIFTILMLRVDNKTYSTTTIRYDIDIASSKKLFANHTYVKNVPLEVVNVEYKRNIYFTVKTTAANYQERLSTLILTWFQTVHKDDVSQTLSYQSVDNLVLLIAAS